ncbi:cryptochrome/photolyase family protein [Xinfangfangia pollutisoli]|uniref:cryptochrome/photolyase family protein n=1 Tax=Xinfangfangia pollutisoli TaxID=2865960 RepID=UPI001CD5DD90|nr:deoxyribodipyrimidine photo-lyase [Xinfangfangia pollutisoli]
MGGAAPLILWFRRDLRLDDLPMVAAAADTGRAVLPVFLLDPETEALGAAAKGRLGLALAAFAEGLAALGLPLILRRGAALPALQALVAETGARAVWWTRSYDPAARARDGAVKAALKEDGIEARSFPGALLAEPWELETGQGGPYRVYTPFWTALRRRGVAPPAEAGALYAADPVPSEALADWHLDAAMNRGAAVVWPYQHPGEPAAQARLAAFLAGPVETYAQDRDRLDRDACSGLSENLAWGEIGPRRIWHAALAARDRGAQGAEKFLSELAWRDFAWHLLYHFPQMATENWRADWDAFPWRGDSAEAEAWRRGQTGEPLVDAAMRELWVTGRMHNRARMVVASYLTKHLLTHWRIGQEFFAQTLTDWDPASNAMGWQWVAGSGPDAAPYFRIFNPESQAQKFDPDGAYRRRWLAGGQARPGPESLAYYRAVPRAWGLSPGDAPPKPLIGLAEGRARALAAYAEARS